MSISPALISSTLASFRLQALSSMSGTPGDFGDIFSLLVSPSFTNPNPSAGLADLLVRGAKSTGLSAGRNMSLADPESAYRMMTVINGRGALYKAQHFELSRMSDYVAGMEKEAGELGCVTASTDNSNIKSVLQDFASHYNDWIQRFRPFLQDGGLLDGMQAAEISQYELEQSVKWRFYGVRDGLNGLGDIGMTVDPATQSISLDTARLDAVLASNKQGVVDVLQEFSAGFAKAANLLNSQDNFIPNQLDNLGRAIRFIGDHNASLRAEFGTGDAAKPTGQVAEALAAYNSVHGVQPASPSSDSRQTGLRRPA